MTPSSCQSRLHVGHLLSLSSKRAQDELTVDEVQVVCFARVDAVAGEDGVALVEVLQAAVFNLLFEFVILCR